MKIENEKKTNNAIILIVCPDQPGLVAFISNFIHQNNGNIVYLDQHTDYETSTFLMRVEWELNKFKLNRELLDQELKKHTQKYKMDFELFFSDKKQRLAIMVSKYQHCLYDLLVRHALGEIDVEIPVILSNHPDLANVAQHFNIPFELIEVNQNNKESAEKKQLDLLKKHKVDLLVLARYMQILSQSFIDNFSHPIINIHHSFLPAFKGSRPYHQAYAKGVKIIGATSHYVTPELDAGPIIHQCVTQVSHLDQVEDLIRKGRDQEKGALAYAVRMHLQHRVLTYNNKTVVFT